MLPGRGASSAGKRSDEQTVGLMGYRDWIPILYSLLEGIGGPCFWWGGGYESSDGW